MINGSCLCGQVRYEISGEMGPISHCHCPSCRKAHAGAFSSVAAVQLADLRFTAGEALLKFYESSPGKKRYFCSNCGSQIYAKREGQNHYIFRMGTIDGDPGTRPAQHIFTRYRAAWYNIDDDIPEYSEWATPAQQHRSSSPEYEQLCSIMKITLNLAARRAASTSLLLLEVNADEQQSLATEITHEIKGTIRASDLIEPLGNGRFAVLLPYTDARAALILAERIRKSVKTVAHPAAISIGAATLAPDQLNETNLRENIDALINMAEKACQSSNKSGGEKAIHFDS